MPTVPLLSQIHPLPYSRCAERAVRDVNIELLTAGCQNPVVTGKSAMAVMVKTPRSGFSKTRLCPPLLSEEAASISRCFPKDTSAAIQVFSWDGGYYALGLRTAHPRLFEDVTWNTDRVYVQTVERAKEINLPVIALPAWYNVDDQISLSRFLGELFPERADETVPHGSPAPYTREFLRQILAGEGPGRIWSQTSSSARSV